MSDLARNRDVTLQALDVLEPRAGRAICIQVVRDQGYWYVKAPLGLRRFGGDEHGAREAMICAATIAGSEGGGHVMRFDGYELVEQWRVRDGWVAPDATRVDASDHSTQYRIDNVQGGYVVYRADQGRIGAHVTQSSAIAAVRDSLKSRGLVGTVDVEQMQLVIG